MIPAYVTLSSTKASEQIWYPNSSAASRMTPDDGKVLTKSSYFGSSLVKVRNGIATP